MNCKNCNSENIEKDVKMGINSGNSHDIGPMYFTGLSVETAKMVCDICIECGEITRVYIKDGTHRKWIHK